MPHEWDEIHSEKMLSKVSILGSLDNFPLHTVDGQNPAPPRMMIIPVCIGF